MRKLREKELDLSFVLSSLDFSLFEENVEKVVP